MGLLDSQFWQSPQGVGLLSGIASYAMNARKGTPVNNIGRGLAGGVVGYQQAAEQGNAERLKQQQAEALRGIFMPSGGAQQTAAPSYKVGDKTFADRNKAEQFSTAFDPKQELGMAIHNEFSNAQLPENTDFSQFAAPPYTSLDMTPRQGVEVVPGQAQQPAMNPLHDRIYQAAQAGLISPADAFKMLNEKGDALKPQLVETWDEKGRPIKKWVMPGQADGVMVGSGKPEEIKPMPREDVHIGGGQWSTMEYNPETRLFDKPIGTPFSKRPTASDTKVNVEGARVFNEAEKKLGAGMGDYAIELRKNADSAYRVADEVSYVVNALKGYGGGPLTEAKAYVGKFAPDSEWGKLASVGELATTIQAKLAPSMRAAGSGATSDFEMKMWMKAIPTLATTENGRLLIEKYTNRVAERASARADIEAQLIDERGRVDYAEVGRRMKARFGDGFIDQSDKSAFGSGRQSQGTFKDPIGIKNDADYNNVPSGKYYKAPDGTIRVKK